ncbi:hypothetical protein J6590_035307 [Homalodisca vitripennis]|nr:hypothetical protein J6590_035307 [Homalodisca vitripennis]
MSKSGELGWLLQRESALKSTHCNDLNIDFALARFPHHVHQFGELTKRRSLSRFKEPTTSIPRAFARLADLRATRAVPPFLRLAGKSKINCLLNLFSLWIEISFSMASLRGAAFSHEEGAPQARENIG